MGKPSRKKTPIPGSGSQDASCAGSLGSDTAKRDQGMKPALSREGANKSYTQNTTLGHAGNRVNRQLKEEQSIIDGYIDTRNKGKTDKC